MKKILCMALCLIMVFSLCACGGKTDTSVDNNNSGTTITDTDTSTTTNSTESDTKNEVVEDEYANKIACLVVPDEKNIIVKHNLDSNYSVGKARSFTYPDPTGQNNTVDVLRLKFDTLEYLGLNVVVNSKQELEFGFISNEAYETFTTCELQHQITYDKDFTSKTGITYKVYSYRMSSYYFALISEDYAVVFRGAPSDEPIIDSFAFTVEK